MVKNNEKKIYIALIIVALAFFIIAIVEHVSPKPIEGEEFGHYFTESVDKK